MKNICISTAAILAGFALVLAACGGNSPSSTAEYIGIDAAKEAALADAGISADEADFSSAGLDNQNGTFYYEVNFTGNGAAYEYDIDAVTGLVIEKDQKTAGDSVSGETPEIPAESAAAADASEAAAADASESAAAADGTSASAAASGPVTEEQAKSIALSQAGLTEDQVAAMRTETHTRRGQSVFEVEFRGSDGSEYSCDISASDGSVISYDYDARGNAPTVNTEAGMLSEEQIRAAVLDRVPGASADSIRLELDEDDSRLIYEGELFYDNTEYEFQIDAYSGAVLEWESDSVRRP